MISGAKYHLCEKENKMKLMQVETCINMKTKTLQSPIM